MAILSLPRVNRSLHCHSYVWESPFLSSDRSKTRSNCYQVTSRTKNFDDIYTPDLGSIKSRNVNNSPIISTLLRRPRPTQSLQCAGFSTSANPEKINEKEGWVDLYLPKAVRPYARLARVEMLIGTLLFLAPSAWGVALAANPGNLPDMKLIALFCIWAQAFHSAACTINDFFDRDFDKQVARTKNRPFPSGAVSPAQGLMFFGFQVLLGLVTLLQMNTYSFLLGALEVPFMIAYPLMKRVTNWPQAFLGVLSSFGALLGWAAVKGSLDPVIVLPLSISCVLWTLIFDTIYAHQDKEDDVKAGVKSTALEFGDSTKKWFTGFAVACIGSLALTGFIANIGWPYYALLAVASLHLAWQIITVDLSSPADCYRKFVANKWFGAIVFTAILLGRVVPGRVLFLL